MIKTFFRILLAGTVLAGLVALYYYRTWLPDMDYLRVREVVILPEAPLTAKEMGRYLPPLIGKNLLVVSGDEIMKKVRANPWVLSAVVKKEFPHRLVIQIRSKRPVATRQDSQKLFFIDENGEDIDRWTAQKAKGFDLPVIAYERPELIKHWKPKTVVQMLAAFQKTIGDKHTVSQWVPSDPPYFKVFLTSPPLELLFSQNTWETQLPFFADMLSRPPQQIGQAHKINLVFPKKAVVSLPLSH